MPLFTLLSSLIKPVSSYLGKRQELAAVKHQGKLALQQARVADMSSSWKDEFILVILFYPLILRALGGTFDAFSVLPQFTIAADNLMLSYQNFFSGYYPHLLTLITSAVFGIKWHRNNKVISNLAPIVQRDQEQPVQDESPPVAEEGTPKRKRKPTKAQFKNYLR